MREEVFRLAAEEVSDYYVMTYGDLLIDLCQTILSTAPQAQAAFRSILRKIRSEEKNEKFETHERAWVLKIACDRLLSFHPHEGCQVSPEEQIRLDASDDVAVRLKHFHSYFHRLRPEDQILLLLKDKYQISYSEIASALQIPEGSLKIKRQQALRALEEWLWKVS